MSYYNYLACSFTSSVPLSALCADGEGRRGRVGEDGAERRLPPRGLRLRVHERARGRRRHQADAPCRAPEA